MAALERLGDEDSWGSYRRMILAELRGLHRTDEKIFEKLDKIILMQGKQSMDTASLKAKSGIWGMLGGLIPVVVALAMLLIGGYGRSG